MSSEASERKADEDGASCLLEMRHSSGDRSSSGSRYPVKIRASQDNARQGLSNRNNQVSGYHVHEDPFHQRDFHQQAYGHHASTNQAADFQSRIHPPINSSIYNSSNHNSGLTPIHGHCGAPGNPNPHFTTYTSSLRPSDFQHTAPHQPLHYKPYGFGNHETRNSNNYKPHDFNYPAHPSVGADHDFDNDTISAGPSSGRASPAHYAFVPPPTDTKRVKSKTMATSKSAGRHVPYPMPGSGGRPQRRLTVRGAAKKKPPAGEESSEEEEHIQEWCIQQPCTYVSPPRKMISQFFGRNKTCSNKMVGYMVIICRKHYQRKRYHIDKEGRYFMLQYTFVRDSLWARAHKEPLQKWDIKCNKNLRDCMNELNRLIVNEPSPNRQPSNGSGTEDDRRIGIYPISVLKWIQRHILSLLGKNKCTDDCLEILDLMRDCCMSLSFKSLPVIEFLPGDDY